MTINIPLSQELLMWWIKNAKMNDDYTLAAPLPIRLDFSGNQRVDLSKAGVSLECDYEGVASVNGDVYVSSDNPKAQARMFGLEYMRDRVKFELTKEEQAMIHLMSESAQMIATRAQRVSNEDVTFVELFDNKLDYDNQ